MEHPNAIPAGFEAALDYIQSHLDTTLPDPASLGTEAGRLDYSAKYGKIEHIKDLRAALENHKRRRDRQ